MADGKERTQSTSSHSEEGNEGKLVELAQKNAQMVLKNDRERLKREEGRTIGAVKELEKILGLKGIIRMEAYDISNTNGFDSVGSMVVYEHGKPKRNDYRKFKIKTVQGPDDYASMNEVLTRRFGHGLREQQEESETGGFQIISGSDHDGRRTGAGEYSTGSTGKASSAYSGVWNGKR